MSHISLIEYTSKEVYNDSNSSNNGKYCPWTHGLLRGFGSHTGGGGEDLEMI